MRLNNRPGRYSGRWLRFFCSAVGLMIQKKGGDIDLYIKSSTGCDLAHKVRFLISVEEKIGEQKIDVIFALDKTRPIEQQAVLNGVLL